ncbi:hypothetical protein L9F63_014159, partial [Diploptera punctata]
NRLLESLAKFQEYEDTLESIMRNLEAFDPIINEEVQSPVDLKTAQQQLETVRTLHNKLQAEKSRLAVAVQACEAAAACISRPSSPQDTMPPPVPDRELAVRARLEDLIDQKECKSIDMQLKSRSHSCVKLEELQRQRASLQQWVTEQNAVVTDWRSRPSKLRPEAARAELVSMQELLGAIGERKARLISEIQVGEETGPNIEEQLNNLESDLTQVMAKKQRAQNVIEEYRTKLQDIHGWFDSLVKRMEALDKGSGLDCAQKLVAISEIGSEFESQGAKRVGEVKRLAGAVVDVVSNLDSQQVEEQLKSVERRYNDIAKRVQRKAQVLEMARKGLDGARQEIEQAREWIRDKMRQLENLPPLGFESKVAEDRLQLLRAFLKEAEGKQVVVDTLEKRVNNMQAELEPAEQQQLETGLKNLALEQNELCSKLKAEIDRVSSGVDYRKKFEAELEEIHAWLKAKSNETKKMGGYLPLRAMEVEKEIQQFKDYSNEVKNSIGNRLNDLQKEANSLMKECSDPDKKRLQILMQAIIDEYDTLKKHGDEKLAALNDLLQGRRQFEADVDRCQHWLNEAEVATSAEIRAPNVDLLQEQLSKYDKLNSVAGKIGDEIENIIQQGKAILPTVSEADKLMLSEQLNAMKDKHGHISNIIRDRSNALKDQIKQYKLATARMEECVNVMSDIQKEMKELNRPVGSKVEDVQGMLHSYEKILAEMKANKLKLGDLQVGSMGDLQGLNQQQDDLIQAIEAQIAKLRQLLLLREQFIALITEIMTFITKYTEIVRDIEKGGHTIQEKIKKYDDVIVKIQECEAMLASATDKGQQIAEEGSAADRNNITEQLQSMKQQLQALRRAVEKQREQHEMAAAEHKKLAAELETILDWLHANETTVRSRPLLERDPASVEKEIEKHKELAAKVNSYLDRVRTVQESVRHEEGMPGSLMEQLSEANSLLTTLPQELEERGKYLETNKQLRFDYAAIKEKLFAWVKEADSKLQTGKFGVDFENVIRDLEEHKIFFSSEASIRELVSQQIQQAADRIWPSLTGSEQEELSREQQQHTQLLKNTLNSARSQRAQLEQDVEIWKDFCQTMDKVRSVLARSQFTDEPVTSFAGLHFNIQKITHALNDIQNQQAEIDLLNERGRDITRQANHSNREHIEKQLSNINREWNDLVSGLESRRDTLTKLAQHWEEFVSKWQAFESLISGNEEKARHIDTVVLPDPSFYFPIHSSLSNLLDLLSEVEGQRSLHEEVLFLSGTVLTYLKAFNEISSQVLKGKLDQLTDSYKNRCSPLR